MVGKITQDNILSFMMTLLCCVLFMGTFYRSMSMIILVSSLLVLGIAYWVYKPKKSLERNEKLFVYALIFFFVSALLSFLIGKGWELQSVRNPNMPSLIDLDLPSKYVMGALVFAMFLKLRFKLCKPAIMGAIALGAILNGGIAIYQRYFLGHSRVAGFSGIAEMADASAILCLFCAVLFVFAPSLRGRVFYGIAIFLASLASLLTMTRGAILGMIITLIFMGVIYWFYRRECLQSFLIVVGICVLSFLANVGLSGGIKDSLRLEIAQQDLQSYAQGNTKTSLGARFEMWKEAVAMFKMAPIFGLSTAEIEKKMPEILQKSGSQLIETKEHNPNNDARGKKHNQILNAAAKRGIIGVFAILFVWFAYIKLFASRLKDLNSEVFVFALLSLSLLCYCILPNSLAGEPWESNVTLPLVLLIVSIFLKMTKEEERCSNPFL